MTSGVIALKEIGLQATIDQNFEIAFSNDRGLNMDLCKLQNRRSVTQGDKLSHDYFQPDLKVSPLFVDNKNMGTLKNLNIKQIKDLATPSSSIGSKTENGRNTLNADEIKGDRIKLEMPLPWEVQKIAPMGHKIEAKFHKLLIYEKPGLYSRDFDSQDTDDHLGTFVVFIPTENQNGTFILSDDENELPLPLDKLCKDGNISWLAFYSDLKFQIEMTHPGPKIILQFKLVAEKDDPKYDDYLDKIKNENLQLTMGVRWFSIKLENLYHFQGYNQEVLSSILRKLNIIFSRPKNQEERTSNHLINPDGIAFMLKRRYSTYPLSVDKLKGSDFALYNALKDKFIVELKSIILEQDMEPTYIDENGMGELLPIRIIALSNIANAR